MVVEVRDNRSPARKVEVHIRTVWKVDSGARKQQRRHANDGLDEKRINFITLLKRPCNFGAARELNYYGVLFDRRRSRGNSSGRELRAKAAKRGF
jgi:hypothetical protein